MINRGKFKAVTGAAVLLVAMSSCTKQQIADAVALAEASTEQVSEPAPPPDTGPRVIASVDCVTFNIEVTGYEAGTHVLVGEGSQPPYGFTVGSDVMWQFAPLPGGGRAAIPIGLYESTHEFHAIVDIDRGAGNERMFDQIVDCTP